MKRIISKTIIIKSPSMPPKIEFIEEEFKKINLDVIRWAIVDVEDNNLTLSVCAFS